MKGEDANGWLADRLGSARADAERIARELADKGHLTQDQATTIVAAVDTAIASGRELLADALREPQRLLQSLRATMRTPEGALSTSPASDHVDADVSADPDVHARIDGLEERIATLEVALLHAATRSRRGSEGD